MRDFLCILNRWFRRCIGLERIFEEMGALDQSVCALNLEEAKGLALEVLRHPTWNVISSAPKPDEVQRLAELGPAIREFFSTYEAVDNLHSNFSIRREQICEPFNHPHLSAIGQTLDFSPLAVGPNDDTVLIFGDLSPGAEIWGTLPSIYHLIAHEGGLMEIITIPVKEQA